MLTTLVTASRLGVYEITAPIGEGGMGQARALVIELVQGKVEDLSA